MPWLFALWGLPGHQLEPQGAWSVWLAMGGRGAGKTRTGAEWVRRQVEGATPLGRGRCCRVALLAETADQARDIMLFGDSGLMRVTPPDRRPAFQITRRRLCWPNGAEAWLFSARDPESLRGPQFDCAWSDELGKWRFAQPAWDMLQFGLRLGRRPRQIVTTTPRRNPVLLAIMEDPATIVTNAPTEANRANLAPGFLARITQRYGGTALGRQELDGKLLLDHPGALWTRAMIESCRRRDLPSFARVVVAVDPPVRTGAGADACGIVVAALDASSETMPCAWVLADRSVHGRSPRGWAERVVACYHEFRADRVVAEINQGGDLVEEIIRQIDPDVAFKGVYARRGKILRAEPVSALYEQGRVFHAARFDALEDQMCAFTHESIHRLGTRSPDRVDALVWAISELLVARAPATPRVREL